MIEYINGMTYDEFIEAVVHRVREMRAEEEYSIFKKMLEACDTVQVVRCRDCVNCNVGWCMRFQDIVKSDGFCAWGEMVDICR